MIWTSTLTGPVSADDQTLPVAAVPSGIRFPGQASQHAAMSHASGAVADGTNAPPSFVTYIFERTA